MVTDANRTVLAQVQAFAGDLRDTPLPELLMQLYAQQGTGSLVIASPDGSDGDAIYFDAGTPVAARASRGAKCVIDVLLPLCARGTGRYAFHPDENHLGGHLLVHGAADPLAAIAAALRGPARQDAIDRAIDALGAERFRLKPFVELDRYGFTANERSVVDGMGEAWMTTKDLLVVSPLHETHVKRLLYVLCVTRALTLPSSTDRATSGTVTRRDPADRLDATPMPHCAPAQSEALVRAPAAPTMLEHAPLSSGVALPLRVVESEDEHTALTREVRAPSGAWSEPPSAPAEVPRRSSPVAPRAVFSQPAPLELPAPAALELPPPPAPEALSPPSLEASEALPAAPRLPSFEASATSPDAIWAPTCEPLDLADAPPLPALEPSARVLELDAEVERTPPATERRAQAPHTPVPAARAEAAVLAAPAAALPASPNQRLMSARAPLHPRFTPKRPTSDEGRYSVRKPEFGHSEHDLPAPEPRRRARKRKRPRSRPIDAERGVFYHRKAEALVERQSYDRALSQIRAAISADDTQAEYEALHGWLLFELRERIGDAEHQARVHLNRALKLDPRSAKVHYYAGMVLKRQGHAERAYEHFAQAASLDPEDLAAGREVRLYEMRSKPGREAKPSGLMRLVQAIKKPGDGA